MKIHFKFKPEVDDTARKDLLSLLRAEGASKVRRLFPRASTPDLEDHYVVEATPDDVQKLLPILRGRSEVAYAQPEVKRQARTPSPPDD
jgi:hypothetical protein